MTAYIAYENLIPLGSVAANSAPGYPLENAYDWFTYTWWQGAGGTDYKYTVTFNEDVTVNYAAIASHNLADAGGWISFDDQNNDFIVDPFYPLDNRPLFFVFPDEIGLSFRFRFVADSPAFIGVLSFGQMLELPEGIKPAFTPPQWGHDDVIISSKSQSGVFLGRSVERYGLKHRISQSQVDPVWMRENWLPLADAIRTQPFFYSWNQEEYPEDAVYAWLDDKMPVPMYTNPVYTDFSINCRCIHDPKQSPVPS